MPQVTAGDKIPLSVQLFDGATNKFIRARLYDKAGLELAGSPVALVHTAGGLYQDDSYTMPAYAVLAQYKIYDDSGFTTPSSLHSDAMEIFDIGSATTGGSISNDLELSGTIEMDLELTAAMEADDVIHATIEEC